MHHIVHFASTVQFRAEANFNRTTAFNIRDELTLVKTAVFTIISYIAHYSMRVQLYRFNYKVQHTFIPSNVTSYKNYHPHCGMLCCSQYGKTSAFAHFLEIFWCRHPIIQIHCISLIFYKPTQSFPFSPRSSLWKPQHCDPNSRGNVAAIWGIIKAMLTYKSYLHKEAQ